MALPANPVAAEIARAVAAVLGISPDDVKIDPPPRPELGDFAVPAFPLAKLTKEPPPAVAARVARDLPRSGVVTDVTATGPFINVKVDRAAALRVVLASVADAATLIPARGGAVVCIDYSSPNISKHLAYHHIRSTMLGHALASIHEALGYTVVGINHLGDWGTTHGMLLAAFERWGAEPKYQPLDVTGLNDLYVRFREAMKADPALGDEGRAWFKRLEDGEPEARARWQQFRDISWREFDRVYQRLGVHFTFVTGESEYEDKMPEILAMLAAKGLLSESEGAQVVAIPGEKTPMLIKTKDGTTLYATRDLAAALYRWRQYGFARSLYVVDRGQSLHFKQLFAVLGMLGFDWAARCTHVPFGLVRFGGKKTTTRGGNVVLLDEVFAEASEQVRPLIAEAQPDMPAAQLDRTAEQIGVGAVVFANVLPQRDKDVEFDWDKVLSLSGDSGPYLQYTLARCWSIHRKAGAPALDAAVDVGRLTHDAEWAVARRLLDVGDYVARAADNCEPHVVAHYLLELAGDFSRWYTLGNGDADLRVLCDDADVRAARLALVAAVRTWLTRGLAMLGLGAPEVM
ncbi:MAG: arginine--tRNA ligase [Myxococcales bacterium]|nr:arginine--tRNA ligase [Myxococcales bacterium]